MNCPTCSKEFCSLCSSTWHPGLSCAENGALLVARGNPGYEEALGWNDTIKKCPMCHVPIERDAGCAQMMCKRCKHVFCWYCLSSLDVRNNSPIFLKKKKFLQFTNRNFTIQNYFFLISFLG